jgi:hypothetical protein
MKLYTEEQVKKVLAPILLNPPKSSSSYDLFFDSLTPIELPSDEEIEKKAWDIYWEKYPKNLFSDSTRPDLVIGYVRFYREFKEQILNQNK